MVSINGSANGLYLGRVTNSQKTNKAQKRQYSSSSSTVGAPSQLAEAVARSLGDVASINAQRAQLQYDLPEGRSRKAMEEYLSIMNHAQREELTNMLGVDLYI